MPRYRILLGGVLLVLAAEAQAMAAPRHQDRPWFTRPHIAPLRGVPFSQEEERLIRAYFAQHPQEAAPLSAFARSAIARGKPLPLGAPRAPAPGDLLAQLAPREGCDILLIGRDMVIFETRRALAIDVLRDVLGPGGL